MSAAPNQPPLLRPPEPAVHVSMQALEECVRALDPASRALLDLSLRRRLPLEAMAAVLRTDPFDLARRRARAVARIAADLDLDGAGVVASVKTALARLADEAWLVPLSKKPVQAEEMATQARALMERLRERQAEERASRVSAHVPPTPTSPFSIGLARIADEDEREDEDVVTPPPPLAEALRRAAESEFAAAPPVVVVEPEPVAAEPEVVESSAETIEFVAVAPEPAPVAEPLADLIVIPRASARKIARGGVIVAILAAILRFLFRR
jgi:hypothetical protein